jgi:hypothetical protein
MKWYQLHLSTLLAVTILASVFVWLNARERDTDTLAWIDFTEATEGRTLEYQQVRGRGWPSAYEWWDRDNTQTRGGWDWTTLWLDAIFCVLLLAIAGALIKRGTRRVRSRRTGHRT